MVGADARHMNETLDASGGCGLGDGARAGDMDRLVPLAAALEWDAGRIDHGLAAGDRGCHRLGVSKIGPHHGDLADVACGLYRFRKLDPAHGDAHAHALLRQRPHNGPADEAAAAENRDLRDAHGCCL